MPQLHYAHVQAALDALTGPIGGTVRVFTNGDTDDFHEAPLVEAVVMDGRLEAIVLQVTDVADTSAPGPFRVVIRWETVDTLIQIQEPTS